MVVKVLLASLTKLSPQHPHAGKATTTTDLHTLWHRSMSMCECEQTHTHAHTINVIF